MSNGVRLRRADVAINVKDQFRSPCFVPYGLCFSYRINAEMLSKLYWLNFGLLGFLLVSAMMATSLCRIAWYDGTNACFAVMMTRMTPGKFLLWSKRHLI
jgi:hypothetical protein